MANLKSSQKDIRRTERRAERNLRVRSRLKTLAKKLATAEASGDVESAKVAAKEYISALDKAAKSNAIHVNRASRQKAHCSKLLLA
jgi:small subunit ribosomal protein S20